MNRSIHVLAEAADEIVKELGGVVNGSSWKNSKGELVVLVTFVGREESPAKIKGFNKFKKAGKIVRVVPVY